MNNIEHARFQNSCAVVPVQERADCKVGHLRSLQRLGTTLSRGVFGALTIFGKHFLSRTSATLLAGATTIRRIWSGAYRFEFKFQKTLTKTDATVCEAHSHRNKSSTFGPRTQIRRTGWDGMGMCGLGLDIPRFHAMFSCQADSSCWHGSQFPPFHYFTQQT